MPAGKEHMFAKINCAGLSGIHGFMTEVEADAQNGIPGLFLTGALSQETTEARFRVWNAVRNCGMDIRPKKLTVNISPASLRKEGTAYDMSIAMAILCSLGELEDGSLSDLAFLGETGLDGRLKRVNGVLPLALCMRDHGIRGLVIPEGNLREALSVEDMDIYAFSELREAVRFLRAGRHQRRALGKLAGASEGAGRKHERQVLLDGQPVAVPDPDAAAPDPMEGIPDFSDIRGQAYLKRAAEIAVAGRHNILFTGPAGTGKTTLARAMTGILPGLTRKEDLEISAVYSIAGLLSEDMTLMGRRPFRAPHHGISASAFLGGGRRIMPGELSLASGGILFLDEFPLFQRNVIESLRQPLEDGSITVQRVGGSVTYPADIQLVASMNGCPCGHFPSPECHCTSAQIRAYMGRLSKPIVERIDICAEARPLGGDAFLKTDTDGVAGDRPESSAEVRLRVEEARRIQDNRFRSEQRLRFNGRMGLRETERYCILDGGARAYMSDIFKSRGLSGRTYHKILRVARTIADLDHAELIREEHVMEAAELRSIESRIGAYGIGRR